MSGQRRVEGREAIGGMSELKYESQGSWQQAVGGVTLPRGFQASGVHCGIKKSRPDLALIVSEKQAAAAGVFTSNLVKAAPVLVTMEHLKSGCAGAIVANSGNANACTGEIGLRDAGIMADEAACALGINPQEVLVASTGIIGKALPMDEVREGIHIAASRLSPKGSGDAAKAILTTDLTTKEIALTGHISDRNVSIGGISKGSGMIHPNMATMLGFITTDVAITPVMLKKALVEAVDESFNMITVDGDTSTNDMVIVMANGLADNPVIDEEGPEFHRFCCGLRKVMVSLAKMIVKDGEGATKFVEVRVVGADTVEDARRIAKTVASSNLVKTAIFGADPNWGRILAAAGRAGVDFRPDLTDVYIGDVLVASSGKMNGFDEADAGKSNSFDEADARKALAKKDTEITIDLNIGSRTASAWTCDLTYDYIKINASYTS
jgi:glutamate N-acetyltransferase/amino-acid N-acetyltransferase